MGSPNREPVDLSQLQDQPATVQCPACKHHVQTVSSNRRQTTSKPPLLEVINKWLFILFGWAFFGKYYSYFLPLMLTNKTRDKVHYCSRCGIRVGDWFQSALDGKKTMVFQPATYLFDTQRPEASVPSPRGEPAFLRANQGGAPLENVAFFPGGVRTIHFVAPVEFYRGTWTGTSPEDPSLRYTAKIGYSRMVILDRAVPGQLPIRIGTATSHGCSRGMVSIDMRGRAPFDIAFPRDMPAPGPWSAFRSSAGWCFWQRDPDFVLRRPLVDAYGRIVAELARAHRHDFVVRIHDGVKYETSLLDEIILTAAAAVAMKQRWSDTPWESVGANEPYMGSPWGTSGP